VLPDNLGAAGAVPCDDILDAAAAAWSAHRIAKGIASSLPDPAQFVDGQSIAIWY
jgi:predicted RNase H-like nuclease